MKPLFVTGSLVHGGAERHSIGLFNRLTERGHECHFVYVKNDLSQLDRLRPSAGAAVCCLHARSYLDMQSLQKLSLLLQRTRPTVLVAANPYALMYAAAARRYAGSSAALMVTFHSTRPDRMKDWLQMLYYRPFFWSADCAVFVCQTQRRYWVRRGLFSQRNETIYNGIDLDYWQPWREQEQARTRALLGFAPSDLVIAMCAVFRPEKNHLQLIEAVAALNRRGISAKGLLIGDGPLRGAIEARSRSLGIAEAVLITGFQQDVRPMLAACDAVALCSTTETFSLAALEAMALAKPVVHSAAGGAEMVRPGQNGFVFGVGDTASLVQALARLADAKTRRRMGEAARDTVEARFSEQAMVERYEKTLLELETTRRKRENVPKPARAH